jgi:hypothetical protein
VCTCVVGAICLAGLGRLTAEVRTTASYNRMLWTALRRKAAYLPG